MFCWLPKIEKNERKKRLKTIFEMMTNETTVVTMPHYNYYYYYNKFLADEFFFVILFYQLFHLLFLVYLSFLLLLIIMVFLSLEHNYMSLYFNGQFIRKSFFVFCFQFWPVALTLARSKWKCAQLYHSYCLVVFFSLFRLYSSTTIFEYEFEIVKNSIKFIYFIQETLFWCLSTTLLLSTRVFARKYLASIIMALTKK